MVLGWWWFVVGALRWFAACGWELGTDSAWRSEGHIANSECDVSSFNSHGKICNDQSFLSVHILIVPIGYI